MRSTSTSWSRSSCRRESAVEPACARRANTRSAARVSVASLCTRCERVEERSGVGDLDGRGSRSRRSARHAAGGIVHLIEGKQQRVLKLVAGFGTIRDLFRSSWLECITGDGARDAEVNRVLGRRSRGLREKSSAITSGTCQPKNRRSSSRPRPPPRFRSRCPRPQQWIARSSLKAAGSRRRSRSNWACGCAPRAASIRVPNAYVSMKLPVSSRCPERIASRSLASGGATQI